MKQRIFRNTSAMVALAVFLTFLAMGIVLYQKTRSQAEESLVNECNYVKYSMDSYGVEYLTQEVGNMTTNRLTLFDASENVLYDSVRENAQVEEEEDRPEVEEALISGSGTSVRYSKTLARQTIYYAKKLDNGMIIRVGATVDSIFQTFFSGITLVGLLITAVLVFAIVLLYRQTDKIIEPINRLDLEHPLDNVVYEELSPLLSRIQQQQDQIGRQMDTLRRSQEEYLAITENMKDGLIVTGKQVVLSINKAAKQLFGVNAEECLNRNIINVSRNETLQTALQEALDGKPGERTLKLNGRNYQILSNPVKVENEITGAVLFIMDVTEKTKAENLRREFTANVSHELKTPLMSISGYAEIIQNRMVRPEDVPDFAGRIYQEANRLKALVEDIIKLSRLEESDFRMQKEAVDLLEIAREACASLEGQAAKGKVKIWSEGEPVQISGVRQVIYEMVYNLCDNAIKYNLENGSVLVSVKKKGAGGVLSVKDTGIGIPAAEQTRIFERFYRVDKSHSRETGGTGLGLSIVKHAAQLHDARIVVDSTPGEGTDIRIYF